jgi:hypothetical protein
VSLLPQVAPWPPDKPAHLLRLTYPARLCCQSIAAAHRSAISFFNKIIYLINMPRELSVPVASSAPLLACSHRHPGELTNRANMRPPRSLSAGARPQRSSVTTSRTGGHTPLSRLTRISSIAFESTVAVALSGVLHPGGIRITHRSDWLPRGIPQAWVILSRVRCFEASNAHVTTLECSRQALPDGSEQKKSRGLHVAIANTGTTCSTSIFHNYAIAIAVSRRCYAAREAANGLNSRGDFQCRKANRGAAPWGLASLATERGPQICSLACNALSTL